MGQTVLNVQEIDVLCLYGESDVHTVFSWLEEDPARFLVWVVEGESAFFEATGSSLGGHPQVRLFCDSEEESLYQRIAWEFVWLRFGYGEASGPAAQRFFQRLEHFRSGVTLLASDFWDQGSLILSNVLKNFEKLPQAKDFRALKGKFQGIPAILCGAGPSLDAAIPEIRSLQDRALLIAGGSAVRALNAHGVFPHLYTHIDPDPPYRRFLEQEMYTQPLFYQDRFASALLERAAGPLVWMPAGGSYPLERWMAEECGIFTEPLESGWTVANICAVIAQHLGCDPIILVGMDFSCRNSSVYAGEIVGEEHSDKLIPIGDNLYSRSDWLMSAQWMQAFAKKHPEARWYRATPGGIELEGIERCALEGLDFSRAFDMQGQLHQVLTETPLTGVSESQVARVKKKVQKSFEKSLEYCDQLLKIWERHYPHSPLDTGEYALLDVELESEVCYREFLLPLWNVWQWPLSRGENHLLGKEIHRVLFFKRVIDSILRRKCEF